MYASLDRIDIGVTDEDETRIAVQTDHREAEEISEDFEMSVVFAVTRGLNPLRTDHADRVRFAQMAQPPEDYLDLLRALGAEVEVMERTLKPAREQDEHAVDRSMRDALRTIAERVLAEVGVFPNEAGLIAVQEHCRDKAFMFGEGPDEDPINYWTAFVELGAVTGMVLQTTGPMDWVRDPDFYGVVPYMMGQGGSLTNVFGKIERYFEHGDSQAPVQLLRIAEDSHGADLDASPVMYNLRPSDWAGIGRAWSRPLFGGTGKDAVDVELPVVALVRDLPSSVASIPIDTDEDALAAMHAEAEANLSKTHVDIERIDGELKLLIVHGSYYASEKVLDVAFMANLAAQLQTEMLMAAIPAKGKLLLASALSPPEHVAGLQMLAQKEYEDAPPADRLSPEVLLWAEGQLLGFARLTPGDPEATPEREPEPRPKPKRTFWSRLFGGGS